jgi:alpha-beta hydrolase superfamily lysophospholipase
VTTPPRRILLHGTRVPGISEFDLPVRNGSLAEDLAKLGHISFIPDARGYGGSDRPAAMDRPPHESKPFARITEITRDVDAAVDELRKVSGRDKVALLGWGVGGTCVLLYAALNPDKVSHVVMYNAPYGCDEPHRAGRGSDWEDPEKPGQFNYRKWGGYAYNGLGILGPHWDKQADRRQGRLARPGDGEGVRRSLA